METLETTGSKRRLARAVCCVCNGALGPLAERYREKGVIIWNVCADCHSAACVYCGTDCLDESGEKRAGVRAADSGTLACPGCAEAGVR